MNARRRESEVSRSTGWPRGDIAVLIAVAIAVAAVYVPMLATGTRIPDSDDFRQLAARQEFVRKSVFDYGVFPLRSHFFGSGYPCLSDPEDTTLSPLTWLLLVLPSSFALKARVFLGAVVGAAGTFLLTRRALGYTRWGGAFAALLFPLAFWLPERVMSGNPTEMFPTFIPLCLFLVLTSARRPLRFFWLPVLFYTMLADGKQSLLAALVLMGIVCAGWCVLRVRGTAGRGLVTRLHPLITLALATAFTVLIGMARILPTMAILLPRGGLWHLALRQQVAGAPSPFLDLWPATQGFLGLRGVIAGAGTLYVGPVPALLFVGGMVLAWRKAAAWGAAVLLMLWLILGSKAPVNLLAALQRMPLGGSFDRPLKSFAPLLVLAISVGAGACFGPLLLMRPRWLGHLLAGAATAAAVLAVAPHAVRMTTDPFVLPAPPSVAGPPDDFYSIAGNGLPRARLGPAAADTYANLCRNVGTIDWYTAVPLPEHGQPRYVVDRRGNETPNPNYRGEAHFQDPTNECTARLEPNRIEVDVTVRRPDVLLVNQNFHAGWRTDKGVLENRDGLLAVRLAEPGRYRVTLRYGSRAFGSGIVLSLVGLGALAWFVVWRRKKVSGTFFVNGPSRQPAGSRSPDAPGRKRHLIPFSGLLGAAIALSISGVGQENWRAFRLARQGDRYYQHRAFGRAADFYRRALATDPHRPKAHYMLGICLQAQGDAAPAEAEFREAIRTDPGLARAYDGLAALFIGRRDNAAAAEVLRQGLAAVGEHDRLTRRLVGLLAACPDDNVRDGPAAVRLGERLVGSTKRKDANALDLLAGAYAEAGRFDEAVQTAREALRLVTDSAPDQAAEIRWRLRLYEARRPFRMPKTND